MEEIQIVLQVLILLSVGCFFIFRKYLFSYSEEKGKNLATKEDVAQITDKIEAVKISYSSSLESTKAELSAQLKTHGFRYEKEYEVLSELTSLLVDVRDLSLNLRPVIDFSDQSKSKEDVKRERLQFFYKAIRALYIAREKKRPFYPNEIYQSILEIEKIAHKEGIGYECQNPFEPGKFREYWDEAEKNQSQITSSVEAAMQKIRERVTKWDSLLKSE